MNMNNTTSILNNEIDPTGRKPLLTRLGNIYPQVILIIFSITVLVASQFIQAKVPPEFHLIPIILIPVSLGLFYLGIWTSDKGHLPSWVDHIVSACASWLKVTQTQFLLLFFSLFFSMLTSVAAGFFMLMYSPVAAVVCWGGAILLAAFGSMDLFVPREKVSKVAILTGLILLAAALSLRAFNTATIPIVLSGDEGASGLFSLNFLNGSMNNIFVSGWYSFPSFHNFLQSLSIAVFGQTTQALRLLSAFAGALTVVLVFFIGRSMFGYFPGLMAALFLTGMHFHNHFSRIGLNNIWDGFFVTLVLGCLWIGWQRDKRAAYIIAGLGLGFAQYFYTTSRVLFLIIGLWVIVAGLSDHNRFRRALPNLVLMVWIALIVLLPLAWFYLKNPNDFFAPMNRVSIFGNWMTNTVIITGHSPAVIILEQLWQGLEGYTVLPSRAWYTPGVPILRPIPGVIFLLGVPFLLLHVKDSRNQLLFAWLVLFAFTGAMSESTPAAQRYVAAAPAAALLICFTMKQLGDLLFKSFPTRQRLIQICLVGFIFILAVNDAGFYYLDYIKNSDFSGFNGMVAQTLANRMKKEPKGTDLVFCGYPNMGYDSIPSLPYLAPQMDYYNVKDAWGSPDTPVPTDDKVYFVFLPDHDSDRAAMELEYPGGTWTEQDQANGQPLYWLYEYNRLK
jgi:4-amino-4-deoxy-L-arabinose transferase-like glycosyltransferase